MLPSFFLLAAGLAASVSAQTTDIQVFNAGEKDDISWNMMEASVVNANPTATTLALSCKDNANKTACFFDKPVTVTEGPSTLTMSIVYQTQTAGMDANATLVQDCDITSSTQGASCSMSFGFAFAFHGVTSSTSTTATTSYKEKEIAYETLAVTGGVSKLDSASATASSGAAATATGSATGSATTETGGAAATGVGIGGAAAAAIAGAALFI